MQPRLILVLLALLLAACGNTPTRPSAADLQNTAAVIAQTRVARTQTALPSVSTSSTTVVTPPPATLTLTPEVTLLAPTLTPPPPTLPPMITPDATQVERWREYQTELAKAILPMLPIETILCEWNILASSEQSVYVWAVCASPVGDDMRPAVIHLDADGSVQGVEIPKRGSVSEFNRLFPEVARVKMNWYVDPTDDSGEGMIRELYSHLEYRKTHPGEPPLVILLSTPLFTPEP